MKSYHAFTSLHREPRGLARLDAVVEAIDTWRGDRVSGEMCVLFARGARCGMALPVASLGYAVTVQDDRVDALHRLQEEAKDVGFSIQVSTNTLDDPSLGSSYDIVFLESATKELREAARQRLSRAGWLVEFGGEDLQSVPGWRPVQMFREARVSVWKSVDESRPLAVQLIPTLGRGGAERVVVELAAGLHREGYRSAIVSLMGGGPLVEEARRRGLDVVVFPRRGPFGSGCFFPLLRWMKRERPHIVHTHLFGADLWGRLAAWWVGVPKIFLTEHNIQQQESLTKRWLNRRLVRVTTRIVAVSKMVAKDVSKRWNVSSKKVKVVPNGIDVSRSISRTTRPFYDVPRLIAVGRLEPQKQHATLLKALARVKDPWSLSVVGVGSLEADLKRLADRLGIAVRIQWLGERDDVPQLLADADVFCFPSAWEGFGLVFLEAAAAGVPIIASDLEVFHELDPEAHATYAASGNVVQWAKMITDILRDPTLAIQRAEKLRKHVVTTCSVQGMVAAYHRLYEDSSHQ